MNPLDKLHSPEWWMDKATSDLYFLCRSLLMTLDNPHYGYGDLYYPTHKLMCDFIDTYAQPGHHCILLTPRHWIKSYLITVGWSIKRTLKRLMNGEREIDLIANATYNNAVEFLKKIKFNFKYNDLLRGIFANIIPDTFTIDKEEELELNGHRICTGAVEKNLVSQHYYVIIHDDLVNKENSSTVLQLRNVHDWWGLAQNLLHPNGIEIIIGTRWHYDDLYGMLIDKFIKPDRDYDNGKSIVELHNNNWHLLQIDCWSDSVNRKGSTFPILFPEETLKELELKLMDRFYGQMENRPYKIGKNPFKPETFMRYNRHAVPAVRYTVMLIDPSGKAKSSESSYTGIIIMHFGSDHKGYVEFGKRFLITDMALAEKIIELALVHLPDSIGIEDVKFDSITDLLELIIEKMIRYKEVPEEQVDYLRQIPNILIELKPKGRPKPVRIKQLTGYVESGQFLFPHGGAEELEDELKRFSGDGTLKDDIADAFAYSLDVMIWPKVDDPPKILIVPDKLKMTDEERIEEEWDKLKEDCFIDRPTPESFPEFELF